MHVERFQAANRRSTNLEGISCQTFAAFRLSSRNSVTVLKVGWSCWVAALPLYGGVPPAAYLICPVRNPWTVFCNGVAVHKQLPL